MNSASRESKKEVWKGIREYIGYVVLIFTFLSIVVPAILPTWGSYERVIVPIVLALCAIVLLRPTLYQWRRWLFRKFRPSDFPDYELQGIALIKEGHRHISARVESIQIILEGILGNDQTGESRLKEVGRKVSHNFVLTTWKQMQEHLLSQGKIGKPLQPKPGEPISADEIDRRLKLWADMEKTAGWGEFRPDVRPLQDGLTGVITIVECFLALGRTEKDRRLCAYLEGYMEGIILGLTGRKVSVHEISCGRELLADKNCIFRVEPSQS
jgi:predicted hydrocarbon binding protein